jgi:hypothetical protein
LEAVNVQVIASILTLDDVVEEARTGKEEGADRGQLLRLQRRVGRPLACP